MSLYAESRHACGGNAPSKNKSVLRLALAQLRVRICSALNLDYPAWYALFDNKPLVDALLDRLQHHCITIRIDGPSLRTSAAAASPEPPSPSPNAKPRPKAA